MISELNGLGVSTTFEIVIEVSQAIMESHWDNEVASHFPQHVNELKRKMEEMHAKYHLRINQES